MITIRRPRDVERTSVPRRPSESSSTSTPRRTQSLGDQPPSSTITPAREGWISWSSDVASLRTEVHSFLAGPGGFQPPAGPFLISDYRSLGPGSPPSRPTNEPARRSKVDRERGLHRSQ